MSSPNTNVEKQVSRHSGPIVGISAVLVFAGLLFVAFLAWTSYQAGNEEAGLDINAPVVDQ